MKTLAEHLKDKNWEYAKEWLLSGKKLNSQKNIILKSIAKQNKVDFLDWLKNHHISYLEDIPCLVIMINTAEKSKNYNLIARIYADYIKNLEEHHPVQLRVPLISPLVINAIEYGINLYFDTIFDYYTKNFSDQNKKNLAVQQLALRLINFWIEKKQENQLELLEKLFKEIHIENIDPVTGKTLLGKAVNQKRTKIINYLLDYGMQPQDKYYEAVKEAINHDSIGLFDLLNKDNGLDNLSKEWMEYACTKEAVSSLQYFEEKYQYSLSIKDKLTHVIKNRSSKILFNELIEQATLEELKEIESLTKNKTYKIMLSKKILEKDLMEKPQPHKRMKM